MEYWIMPHQAAREFGSQRMIDGAIDHRAFLIQVICPAEFMLDRFRRVS